MTTHVALITTTINVPTVLKQHVTHANAMDNYELTVIVAGDVQTPPAARELVEELGGVYLGLNDDITTRWKSEILIGTRSIQRRNIALLHALTLGPDVVVTIDDDNRPIDAGYVSDMISGLNSSIREVTHVDTGWWNPGTLLHPRVTHRGFPITQRHINSREVVEHARGPMRVGVVSGLCLGDPDVDAIERIVNRPTVTDVAYVEPSIEHGVVLGAKTWAPFNTQNTAYAWEVAPLMQCLCGVGRYDDIWMSYVARRVMDDFDYHVRYGLPLVVQERNDHNLIKDLQAEYHGYVATDEFTQLLRTMPVERDLFTGVIDYLDAVYGHLTPFLDHYTNKVNDRWIIDVREAVAEGEKRRAERIHE